MPEVNPPPAEDKKFRLKGRFPMLDYTISKVDIPVYSCRYSIDGPSLSGHKVTIYAECSKNDHATGNDDYYFLELYMSADGYEDRDLLIGVCFGSKPMSQEAIDEKIKEFTAGELNEGFSDLLHHYLQKEHLMEKWLDNTYGNGDCSP